MAMTATSAMIFTAFPQFSVTRHGHREANHDTDEASRAFGRRSQRKNSSMACHVEIRKVSAIAPNWLCSIAIGRTCPRRGSTATIIPMVSGEVTGLYFLSRSEHAGFHLHPDSIEA
jgi:hypothetical protein